MKSILHIATENTAGVPYNVMNMQNMFGMRARMISLYKIGFDYPEDICLDLPLPRNKLAMKWRDIKRLGLRKKIDERRLSQLTYLPVFKYSNVLEEAYMKRREKRNEKVFLNAVKEIDAESFDIFHFDSGIDFFSDSRFAKKMKSLGKKMVNCYYGDDLRTRGIVKDMDELSDLNLTFEYDHTLRHPDIHYLFYPFDESLIKYIDDEKYNDSEKIRIVHSPTHRYIKGTEEVLNAVEKVKRSGRDFEFVLVEKQHRDEVLRIKSTCHIAIDQIGNKGGTGYGINSIETLAMGLPTITDMNGGMDKWLPDNPFIVANADNLAEKIIELLDNKEYLLSYRTRSRDWVVKYHSYRSVFDKLMEYYEKAGIL